MVLVRRLERMQVQMMRNGLVVPHVLGMERSRMINSVEQKPQCLLRAPCEEVRHQHFDIMSIEFFGGQQFLKDSLNLAVGQRVESHAVRTKYLSKFIDQPGLIADFDKEGDFSRMCPQVRPAADEPERR